MLLDLIYPPVCGICGSINKKHLCKKCELKIKQYEINSIEDYRNDKTKYFDYQIKTFKYQDIIRNKIIDYKFNEEAYLYSTFEKMLTKNEKTYSFLKKYDIILYVPMVKKHKLGRGYNQSELIAKQIAKTLGIALEKNNLIKIKDTPGYKIPVVLISNNKGFGAKEMYQEKGFKDVIFMPIKKNELLEIIKENIN